MNPRALGYTGAQKGCTLSPDPMTGVGFRHPKECCETGLKGVRVLVEEKNSEDGETAPLVLLQLSEFSFRSKALGRCKMVFSILKKCSLSTLLSSS